MKGKSPLFVNFGSQSNFDNSGQGTYGQTDCKCQNPTNGNDVETMSSKGKELISRATQPETKKLIIQLYRPGASIGDGGTADALRAECEGHAPSGNEKHYQKAVERTKQIEKILLKNRNHPDSSLLIKLLNDLKGALKGE